MGPYFRHQHKVMFSAACYQFTKSVGKKTLHPTPSIDEKDNIKPLQLVVKSTKRRFIFFEKAYYHSTEFQLSDILMDKEPLKTPTDTEDMISDYNRDTKLSLKGKFGAELSKEILDVDLEASDVVTLDIKFGRVTKSEVNEPKLLEDLSKRRINLDHSYIQQIRLDPKKVLCIITGVVQLPNGGEISRNTEVDAKANVSTSCFHNTSAEAEGDIKKDRDIVLAKNTAIAYNIRELNVDKHSGAMQLVLAEHQHGGFKDSVGYDETDATCVGSSDSPDAGAMNRMKLDMDLQHPSQVFRSIIKLPKTDRQELTSVLLEMLSVARDVEILNTHVIEKLERNEKIDININDLEKQLLSPKDKWMKILTLLGCSVNSAGNIQPPTRASDLIPAMGELFDALTELEDEETDLIRLCSPDTAPALLSVLKNGIKGDNVKGPEVKQIASDSTAQKLLLHLEYKIKPDVIEAPVELPDSIDEVYWTVFALWGTQ